MTDELARTPRVIPWAALTAGLTLFIGAGLTVGAVFLLAGAGWAMLISGIPFLLLSAVIFRGLRG